MRITCDSSCNMGYIYLMPSKKIYPLEEEGNKIGSYFDVDKLSVPVLDGQEIITLLERISVADKTYLQAFEAGEIDEEYQNDKNRAGYIYGIELNLSKNEFLRRIEHNAFQIFGITWKGRSSLLVTIDTYENVFDLENIIYSMNSKNDVFVIVKLKRPYNLALIKAVISSRNDLYPLEYLKTPKYILWE